MKTLKYVFVYLLIIELGLNFYQPVNTAYGYRMDYSIVKDNLDNIDIILQKISKEVHSNKKDDYIIILGDSVAFSGPGPSSQSIGYYMQQLANDSPGDIKKIYNLSMPAMQTGDIYTMLLKLDKYGISTQNIIINIIYAGFIERKPAPAIVFWLKDDLRKMDYQTFQHIKPQLLANGYQEKQEFNQLTRNYIETHLALFRYRAIIKTNLNNHYQSLRYGKPTDDSIGDARPWYKKKELPGILKQPEYQQVFSSQPFDMTENNPQIYFMNKIIDHQQGSNTLVFLAGVNDTLMKDQVIDPDYQKNLALIDNYFAGQPMQYLNCQGRIDPQYFTDHIHLTSDGYRQLAKILWNSFNRE
ncbi:MAG: hypothetical protein ABFC94_12825 [Syntrophomonas sp.]